MRDVPAVTVRTARPHEHRLLERLQFRASTVDTDYRERLLARPQVMTIPAEQMESGRVFVAERAGAVAGFGVTLRRDDGDAELDGLFVEPAIWREGIGRRLVREAERRASDDGATLLHVTANPRAENFYVACGFAFTGTTQTTFGPARTMAKTVRSDVASTPLDS